MTRGIPLPDQPAETADPFQHGFRKFRLYVYERDEGPANEILKKLLAELGDVEDD